MRNFSILLSFQSRQSEQTKKGRSPSSSRGARPKRRNGAPHADAQLPCPWYPLLSRTHSTGAASEQREAALDGRERTEPRFTGMAQEKEMQSFFPKNRRIRRRMARHGTSMLVGDLALAPIWRCYGALLEPAGGKFQAPSSTVRTYQVPDTAHAC